ncbi:unnamed protein product [Gulo gulo]|uniref:Uncharacterized protein n=1 Tax=Gulo gulo TaxID=48420 RepID=A0A9X9LGN8_GULGU|nr:unnamed protein product [Gulo gulo]
MGSPCDTAAGPGDGRQGCCGRRGLPGAPQRDSPLGTPKRSYDTAFVFPSPPGGSTHHHKRETLPPSLNHRTHVTLRASDRECQNCQRTPSDGPRACMTGSVPSPSCHLCPRGPGCVMREHPRCHSNSPLFHRPHVHFSLLLSYLELSKKLHEVRKHDL